MVAEQLEKVMGRVEHAARGAGRRVDEVTLVAVSKGATDEGLIEAYHAGQRDFGESRVHSLSARAAVLPGDISWHFVGTLQSRKAREAADLVSVLHSMDRPSLLQTWTRTESQAAVLIQVNLAEENQKHGVLPSDMPRLLDLASEVGLMPRGLMLIPPLAEHAAENRVWFHKLRQLRDSLAADWPSVKDLSMGMSDDFEVAIAEGATIIRLGRAIFG